MDGRTVPKIRTGPDFGTWSGFLVRNFLVRNFVGPVRGPYNVLYKYQIDRQLTMLLGSSGRLKLLKMNGHIVRSYTGLFNRQLDFKLLSLWTVYYTPKVDDPG